MATFIQTDVSFPVEAGPVLQADAAIDDGTLFLFDFLDPGTWPSQAAAAVGAEFVDLSEISENAALATNSVGWSNGLAFTAGDTARILLPTSSDLASDVEKFGITVWVGFSDLSGTTDSVLTMGKSGSGYDNTQYIIYTNLSDLRWGVCGELVADTPYPTIAPGTVYQIGITIEKNGANYDAALWLNGVMVDTHTVAGPMVDALTQTNARIGNGDIFAGPPEMIVYRTHANDLSGYSPAQFIAADYAARMGEFVA